MLKKIILSTLIGYFPYQQTFADDVRTVCISGDIRHVIHVTYPNGWDLPCEVHFQTPLESRVIWRADKAVGFCTRKAEEIVQRRINSGWHCQEEQVIDSPALTESSLFSDLPPIHR